MQMEHSHNHPEAQLAKGSQRVPASRAQPKSANQAPSKPRVRNIVSFALVQGPRGCGLVVDNLGIGTPMGAWLDSDAIVVAGQAGLVRIAIGKKALQEHWPPSKTGERGRPPMGSEEFVGAERTSIDVMEVLCWPQPSTKDAASTSLALSGGERKLWRVPLLQAARTLNLGTVSF